LLLTNERGNGRAGLKALRSDSCGTLHKADELEDKVRSSDTFRAEDPSDVYPLRVQNPRKGSVPSIDDVDMQLLDDEGGVTLAVFDKEQEIQVYLSYR
jgi:hypothetical protein